MSVPLASVAGFFFNAGARPPRLAGTGRMQPLPGLPRGSKRFGGLLEDEASMGQCLHDVGNVLAVIYPAVRPPYVL